MDQFDIVNEIICYLILTRLSSKPNFDVVIADLYLRPNQNEIDVLSQVQKKSPNIGKILVGKILITTDPQAVENSLKASPPDDGG
jgi:DNA-binding NarL/FixJ family response regulator